MKLDQIPEILFALMGRVDEHMHAANALTQAQLVGSVKDVEQAQKRLLDSLNALAETNVDARKQMLMLSSVEVSAQGRKAS